MNKKSSNNIAKILLAFGVLASPMMLANQVSADNSIANTTNNVNSTLESEEQSDAVTTNNVVNSEEKTQLKEDAIATTENTSVEADSAEIASSTDEKSSDETTPVKENNKDVDFKLDASQKQKLKEAGYTDSEIEAIENSIKTSLAENPDFDVNAFVTSKVKEKNNKKESVNEEKSVNSVNEENKFELSEEAKPEPVAAGEKKITEIQGTIDGKTQSNVTTVKPLASDTGEGYDSILKTAFSFGVPDSVTGGDTFEVKVSDNVNLHGISKDPVIIQ